MKINLILNLIWIIIISINQYIIIWIFINMDNYLYFNEKTKGKKKIINNINNNMNKNYYSFPYNNKKIEIKKEINQKEQ